MENSAETLGGHHFSYAIGKIQSALARRDWKILEDYLAGVQERNPNAARIVVCSAHDNGQHVFDVPTKTANQQKCLCGRWEGVL